MEIKGGGWVEKADEYMNPIPVCVNACINLFCILLI